jgi:hypothetical protein
MVRKFTGAADATAEETRKAQEHPWVDRLARERALRANQARHASRRRRLIDPSTCERDYSVDELEFLRAMEKFKRERGRCYPTWTEVLQVIQGLGYERAVGPRASLT